MTKHIILVQMMMILIITFKETSHRGHIRDKKCKVIITCVLRRFQIHRLLKKLYQFHMLDNVNRQWMRSTNLCWTITHRKLLLCQVINIPYHANGFSKQRQTKVETKGCSQKPGIDYTEVFSPVVRLASLRYLFALAVKRDLYICQMDAVSALLQDDIEKEIFTKQPPMYESGQKENVCL